MKNTNERDSELEITFPLVPNSITFTLNTILNIHVEAMRKRFCDVTFYV